mgnify:FL=1
MVERFVKEHLRADDVIGSELSVNRFGWATGFIKDGFDSISDRVSELFEDEQQPSLGLGRTEYSGSEFLHSCKVGEYKISKLSFFITYQNYLL